MVKDTKKLLDAIKILEENSKISKHFVKNGIIFINRQRKRERKANSSVDS